MRLQNFCEIEPGTLITFPVESGAVFNVQSTSIYQERASSSLMFQYSGMLLTKREKEHISFLISKSTAL